mmetsp:Transcript_4800/g.19600  ORF Transcript_4800/g.19600 Transcript_4800/m.19600 type:complete len:278 (-) Transcript_4800:422-1255(-)
MRETSQMIQDRSKLRWYPSGSHVDRGPADSNIAAQSTTGRGIGIEGPRLIPKGAAAAHPAVEMTQQDTSDTGRLTLDLQAAGGVTTCDRGILATLAKVARLDRADETTKFDAAAVIASLGFPLEILTLGRGKSITMMTIGLVECTLPCSTLSIEVIGRSLPRSARRIIARGRKGRLDELLDECNVDLNITKDKTVVTTKARESAKALASATLTTDNEERPEDTTARTRPSNRAMRRGRHVRSITAAALRYDIRSSSSHTRVQLSIQGIQPVKRGLRT